MTRAMLELREVVKHYPAGGGQVVRPLDGISWTIGRGELAALYGPSGSGKSTLLDIIAAEVAADGGQVLVNGRDVTEMTEGEADAYRLRQLGYVSQSLPLVPGATVIDNAALKLFPTMNVRDAHRKAKPLLERLGIGDRVGCRAAQLSAGERQRVLIALALAADPVLVLADEPTGTLDASRSRDVLGLLTELCEERGVTMLLATHDPQAAGFAHTTRELRDGRLLPYTPNVVAAEPPAEPAQT